MAPKKPVVYLCVIDTPRDEAICGWTGGERIQTSEDLSYQAVSESIRSSVERIPLEMLDKHIAFSPESWERVKNYMDELKNVIETQCRGSGGH
jgi:hypothetical protein